MELDNITNLSKKINLKKIQAQYSTEVPAVFMINAPCINRECYFIDNSLWKIFESTLKEYHCYKNNSHNNFVNDLNLALAAYLNDYIVLTNDGANSQSKGLIPALRALKVKCFSHNEFKKMLI